MADNAFIFRRAIVSHEQATHYLGENERIVKIWVIERSGNHPEELWLQIEKVSP